MIGFKNYLEERVSDVVYHWTDLDAGMAIINDNKFQLTDINIDSVFGAEQEISKKYGKGRAYYLSVARTRVSGYSSPELRQGGFNFKLNGVEFSKNFRGRAIDYYADFREPGRKSTLPREQEDRIFSLNKEIGNVKKYIHEVEIILPKQEIEFWSKGNMKRFLLTIRKFTGNNIEFYIYLSEKDFRNKRKNLALTKKNWC